MGTERMHLEMGPWAHLPPAGDALRLGMMGGEPFLKTELKGLSACAAGTVQDLSFDVGGSFCSVSFSQENSPRNQQK